MGINEKETEKEKETDDPMEIQDTETETKKETECADKAAGASEETKEKKVDDGRIHLVTKVPEGLKLKALGLSLHGLLEYDETDEAEKTFEVSLCGELFSDLLKREFGITIRKGLENFRTERAKFLLADEPPKKKQKISET